MTDEFTPRLGRPRDNGRAGGQRFSKQVKRAAARLGRRPGRKGLSGTRLASGSPAARAFALRGGRASKFRMRRVVVKVHISRAASGMGRAAFSAHLRYIQRDGTDRDGRGGDLYGAKQDRIDGADFAARTGKDRHQFRIIVSPEDGTKLEDLKPHIRTLMAGVEKDLGTRLDWVAVDHHNTGYPHTHIVVRGKDARGKDLVIARDYLTKGLRARAAEQLTRTLGPRRDLEIAQGRMREVGADRLTPIDRALEQAARELEVTVAPAETSGDRFERTLRLQRLKHLERLGLARPEGSGKWELQPGWTQTLRDLQRRGDIVRSLAAESRTDRGLDVRDFSAANGPVIGETVGDRPRDELRDTRDLLVRDGAGRIWRVELGEFVPGSLPPKGAIVEVTPKASGPRRSDRLIDEIAGVNGGVYSEAAHRDYDPSSSAAYREAHKRRLEALRRAGFVERLSDGSWEIGETYLERAAAYEQARGRAAVRTLSWVDLETQISSDGYVWLDQAATNGREDGFDEARQKRLAALRERGLLGLQDTVLSPAQADSMRAQSRARVSADLARRTGKTDAGVTGDFTGVYERSVNLPHGRFAVLANEKAFKLVPWRPEIERYRGQALVIRPRGNGIAFQPVRTRGLSR